MKMVEKSPLENPFALQIAGNDLGIIQRAVIECISNFKRDFLAEIFLPFSSFFDS